MNQNAKIIIFGFLFAAFFMLGLVQCQKSEFKKVSKMEVGECKQILQIAARRLPSNYSIDCISDSLYCRVCRK